MTTASRRSDDRADPITNIDDARYVKAMSHPLRVRILALLDERTASPVELAGWLGATLGTVAYHVRTLERMGLIELTRQTRVRGAIEHHYRSTTRPRVSDEAWAAAPPIAEQAATERIERNPHSGETKDIALVMMLFEAARLTAENPHDPSAATRRRLRHELSAPVD